MNKLLTTIICVLLSVSVANASVHLTGTSNHPGGHAYTNVNAPTLGTTNQSTSLWVKFDANPSVQQTFIGRGNSTDTTNEIWTGINSNQTLYYGCGTAPIFFSSTTSKITDTNWHSVVFVKSGSNLVVYLDGVVETLSASGAPTCTSLATSHGILIGVFESNNFNGAAKYAEVAGWNIALTAGEAAALAKGVLPNNIRFLNLQMYAPLNQRPGTGAGNTFKIPDLSTNGFTNALQVGTFSGDAQTDNHCPCGRPAPLH